MGDMGTVIVLLRATVRSCCQVRAALVAENSDLSLRGHRSDNAGGGA